MLSCVMGGKSIPCLEGSLTDDAEVGHVQVDLCVPFSGLFSHKRLVAAEAEESSIMPSRNHPIHKRIQVRFVSISAHHAGVTHHPLVVVSLVPFVLSVVALRAVLLHCSTVVNHLLLLFLHGHLVVLPGLLLHHGSWRNLLDLIGILL